MRIAPYRSARGGAALVTCLAIAACAGGESGGAADTAAPAAARVDTVVIDSTRRDTVVPDTVMPDTVRPDTIDTLARRRRDTLGTPGARPTRP